MVVYQATNHYLNQWGLNSQKHMYICRPQCVYRTSHETRYRIRCVFGLWYKADIIGVIRYCPEVCNVLSYCPASKIFQRTRDKNNAVISFALNHNPQNNIVQAILLLCYCGHQIIIAGSFAEIAVLIWAYLSVHSGRPRCFHAGSPGASLSKKCNAIFQAMLGISPISHQYFISIKTQCDLAHHSSENHTFDLVRKTNLNRRCQLHNYLLSAQFM